MKSRNRILSRHKSTIQLAFSEAEKILLKYGDDRAAANRSAENWKGSPVTRRMIIRLVRDYPTE